jgi:uncharacterized membrane protein YqjE
MSEIGATLLALLRTRVALVGVELREETRRVLGLLLLAGLALILAGAALVAFALFVAAAFWETHPLLALGGIVVVYAALAAVLLLRVQASLRDAPIPFEATVREMETDLSMLRTSSPSPSSPSPRGPLWDKDPMAEGRGEGHVR